MPFELPLLRALNHLLGAERWARERLAPFAGDVVAFDAAPVPPVRLKIAEDGRLAPAPPEATPALTVRIGPQALPAFLQGEEQLMRAIDVSGNARLASELLFLARHLRWDAEEDLSRVLGDVAARRIVRGAKGIAAWHADTARRLAESVVDYAAEEARLLVRRDELHEHAERQRRLRDALDRLEPRVDALGRTR